MTFEGATVRVEPDGRPTAVGPAHFSARPDEAHEGTVAIRWKTATEIDNAGFNVYRYPVEAGTTATPERINETLIPADGDGVTGADYVWSDTPGYGTYHYWLEDVEFDGTSTMHPWVTVAVSPNLEISHMAGKVSLRFATLPGWNYIVSSSSGLGSGAEWAPLPAAPHNSGRVTTDARGAGREKYYRLTVIRR